MKTSSTGDLSKIPLAKATPAGLFELLDSAVKRNPSAVYLTDSEREFTYREVHVAARSLATWWKSQGIGRGDRVVIFCQNRAEIAVSLFAAALLGAIYVVLNSKLKAHGLAKILGQAEPGSIVVDDGTIELFRGLETPGANLCIGSSEPPAGWTPWEVAIKSPPLFADSWPGVDVDPVSLVFTSGSTADPRGVTLSHDNITFATAAIQERLRYRPTDVVGCFLPLAFDYGLYQIFLAASAGATLFIGDPNQVGPRLPRILENAGITVLPAVPTIYAGLIALHERRAFTLPKLRAITNTGERLPLAHIERMEKMFSGLEVFPMYGLTECKRVSILLPGERKYRPSSVGRPLTGTEVYAVDENGGRLPPGENGELVVRGRHIAHGYWRAPEETAHRFRKRAPESPVELFTGDRGSIDSEGYIFFAARTDDLIKHRGNRISPAEIEMEACTISSVVEAALLKRPSDDSLHLFVTISDEKLAAGDIIAHLADRLETFKVPDRVLIEKALPKSLNSKIDRKALQQRLGADTNTTTKNTDTSIAHEPVLETAGR